MKNLVNMVQDSFLGVQNVIWSFTIEKKNRLCDFYVIHVMFSKELKFYLISKAQIACDLNVSYQWVPDSTVMGLDEESDSSWDPSVITFCSFKLIKDWASTVKNSLHDVLKLIQDQRYTKKTGITEEIIV